MDPKDIKILVVLAVAVVIVGAIAVVIGNDGSEPSEPSDPKPEDPLYSADMIMVCDYSISKTIPTTYSTSKAPSGKEFVTVLFVAKNVSDESITLNSLDYDLVIDDVQYNISLETYSHKDRINADSVGPGGSVANILVYEVPEGADVSTSRIVWDGYSQMNLYVKPADKKIHYNIGDYETYTTLDDKLCVKVPYVISCDEISYVSEGNVHLAIGPVIYDINLSNSDTDSMGLITPGEVAKGTWAFIIGGSSFDKIYLNNADLDDTLVV